MEIKDFLKLENDDMIQYLIENQESKDNLLNELKIKDKGRFFKVSAGFSSALQNHKSSTAQKLKEQGSGILILSIEDIEVNPFQPRIEISEEKVKELAEQIDEHGLLHPIVVIKLPNGKYQLVAGETRLKAHKHLGLTTIKATLSEKIKYEDKDYEVKMRLTAITENEDRNALDPLELAISYNELLVFYPTHELLGEKVKKRREYVSKVLSILKLFESVLKDLESNKSVKDIQALYYLQMIKDEKLQLEKYEELKNNKITRDELYDFAKALKSDKAVKKKEVYTFKSTKAKATITADLRKLDDDKKKEFSDEINKIMKKFFGKNI